MVTAKEVKAGDPCPQCGGTMVPDPAQAPDKLKERHSLNSHSPNEAARYAERVDRKAADAGIIYKCSLCGYRARFQPAAAKPTKSRNAGQASDESARD